MSKVLKLNTPAVAEKLGIKELDVRPYTNKLSYLDDSKVVLQATAVEPVYRLCKDYRVKGREFSLNIIVKTNNAGHVEKFLDRVAKKITNETLNSAQTVPWVYIEETYKEGK